MITAIVLIFVLLPACARSVDFSRPYYPEGQGDRPRVQLDEQLIALKEKSTGSLYLERAEYDVGRALQLAFQEDEKSPVRLSYISSDLTLNRNNTMLVWTNFQASYRISVAADVDGRVQIVDGIGKGDSNYKTFNAAQEAIEKALLDLKTKINVLVLRVRK